MCNLKTARENRLENPLDASPQLKDPRSPKRQNPDSSRGRNPPRPEEKSKTRSLGRANSDPSSPSTRSQSREGSKLTQTANTPPDTAATSQNQADTAITATRATRKISPHTRASPAAETAITTLIHERSSLKRKEKPTLATISLSPQANKSYKTSKSVLSKHKPRAPPTHVLTMSQSRSASV